MRNHHAGRVLDLGCGTGTLTVELHSALHAQSTLGIDSSPAMLHRASQISHPGVRFEHADIATFTNALPFDVVFSNAALQWVADHEALIPRLATLVAPGGELAVQVPANFDHPSHTLATVVAREAEFATALIGYAREPSVLPPEQYAELLHAHGMAEQHVRLQVYAHVLDSSADVVEWTRGTLLTDYAARLDDPAIFERFVGRYRERVLESLGDVKPYFYAFKRILMWGRKPA